jgi:hypothetical protein
VADIAGVRNRCPGSVQVWASGLCRVGEPGVGLGQRASGECWLSASGRKGTKNDGDRSGDFGAREGDGLSVEWGKAGLIRRLAILGAFGRFGIAVRGRIQGARQPAWSRWLNRARSMSARTDLPSNVTAANRHLSRNVLNFRQGFLHVSEYQWSTFRRFGGADGPPSGLVAPRPTSSTGNLRPRFRLWMGFEEDLRVPTIT